MTHQIDRGQDVPRVAKESQQNGDTVKECDRWGHRVHSPPTNDDTRATHQHSDRDVERAGLENPQGIRVPETKSRELGDVSRPSPITPWENRTTPNDVGRTRQMEKLVEDNQNFVGQSQQVDSRLRTSRPAPQEDTAVRRRVRGGR